MEQWSLTLKSGLHINAPSLFGSKMLHCGISDGYHMHGPIVPQRVHKRLSIGTSVDTGFCSSVMWIAQSVMKDHRVSAGTSA